MVPAGDDKENKKEQVPLACYCFFIFIHPLPAEQQSIKWIHLAKDKDSLQSPH
jgi:hypothetical protein